MAFPKQLSADFFMRCIDAINVALINEIKMPSTFEESTLIKTDFMQLGNIPNVVGAIDGTLIPIRGVSGENEHLFVSRKNFHAINVQAICDAKLRYVYV